MSLYHVNNAEHLLRQLLIGLPRVSQSTQCRFPCTSADIVISGSNLIYFHDDFRRFSQTEFEGAGLNTRYMSLIEFMADQETDHITLLTKILGERALKECTLPSPVHHCM